MFYIQLSLNMLLKMILIDILDKIISFKYIIKLREFFTFLFWLSLPPQGVQSQLMGQQGESGTLP